MNSTSCTRGPRTGVALTYTNRRKSSLPCNCGLLPNRRSPPWLLISAESCFFVSISAAPASTTEVPRDDVFQVQLLSCSAEACPRPRALLHYIFFPFHPHILLRYHSDSFPDFDIQSKQRWQIFRMHRVRLVLLLPRCVLTLRSILHSLFSTLGPVDYDRGRRVMH